MKKALLASSLCAISLFAYGCGDDEDSGDGGGDSAELTAVSIEASGGSDDYTFSTSTPQVEAGPAEITLSNKTSAGSLDGQLVYTEEEHSDEEIISELGKAMSGEAVQGFFEAAGGPGAAAPGDSSTVTQVLEAGTYYVVGGENKPAGPLAKITVTGEAEGDLPEADGTVTASEYAFSSEGLPAGESKILLDNPGGEWHHFIASRLIEGATAEDAIAFFKDEKGPPPFASEEGDLESTVMDPGVSQVVTADLEPGNYAFFCFIGDKQGGPPHVAKGMVSEITVE